MDDIGRKFFSEISSENLVTFQDKPLARVKMVQQQESLDFHVRGRFVVLDEQNNTLHEDFETDGLWRARVDAFTPPTYQYIIFVIEVFEEQEAKRIAEDLQERGFNAWHKCFGYSVELNQPDQSFEVFRYRVFIGPVPTKQKARSIQVQLLGVYHAQIFKIPYRQTRGVLELSDLQRDNALKGTGFIRLKPKSSDASITVHGIRNLNKRMPYTFYYNVEFHIADNGKLYLVGEMDVEEFITGLLTAFFKPEYPIEFLKAMAIAYRSSVLANLRMRHLNEPFDFNRKESFFEFAWQNEIYPKLKTALTETHGKYLVKKDRICDTQQNVICGGHTEHIDIMMNRDTSNSITGRYDIVNSFKADFPVNLSNEANAESWIKSRPSVLCNVNENGMDEKFADYDAYFRWKVEYSRQEVEEIIREKTEEDIGTIYDIVPLLRGGSGRLMELEVLGSNKNVHLIGDYEIRNCLSHNLLPSSSFVIETELGVDGTPTQFVFTGAGYGHGVGMCQAGAIAMTLQDYDYWDILQHYFGKVELASKLPLKRIVE